MLNAQNRKDNSNFDQQSDFSIYTDGPILK